MEDWHTFVNFMLHIPCGETNLEASCCQNKYELCENSFPKDYTSETRSKDGTSHITQITVKKRIKYEYTSIDVVTHNLWLLKLF